MANKKKTPKFKNGDFVVYGWDLNAYVGVIKNGIILCKDTYGGDYNIYEDDPRYKEGYLTSLCIEDADNVTVISTQRYNAVLKGTKEGKKFLQDFENDTYRGELFGYEVRKNGDNFVFGCGEVVLSRKQIEGYVKQIEPLTKMNNIDDLIEVVKQAEDYGYSAKDLRQAADLMESDTVNTLQDIHESVDIASMVDSFDEIKALLK